MSARSGSENRQRNWQIGVRFTLDEWESLKARCDRLGKEPADLLRSLAAEGGSQPDPVHEARTKLAAIARLCSDAEAARREQNGYGGYVNPEDLRDILAEGGSQPDPLPTVETLAKWLAWAKRDCSDWWWENRAAEAGKDRWRERARALLSGQATEGQQDGGV